MMTIKNIKFNWHWLLVLVAIVMFALASKSLFHMAHTLDMTQMQSIITSTPPLTMFKAVAVVMAAYMLLSIYDLIAVRYLKADIPYLKILNTSFTAFSIGHTLGVSMLSAGAVRFRYYGKYGVESTKIANIILLVSLAFSYGMMTVIGISLVVNPHMLSQLLTNVSWLSGIPPLVFRVIGSLILALIIASLLFAGKSGRVFSIKRWELQLPPAAVLLRLIVLAVIDIALVAYIIHILIPVSIQVSYLEVFSAYVQAVTVGIVSHVPGGLGVFELTMVASLPKVDKTTLISVLLLFRVLYYLIPFMLGILSFVLHEAYIRSGIEATERHRILPSVWVPQLLALATAVLGITMLVVSILPPIADRALLLGAFIPIPIVEASYLLNTLMGFALIILARGLYQRLNGAWHLSMWLLGVSIVTLLVEPIPDSV